MDKNGFIERSDFQRITQRYKDLPEVSEEHVKVLSEILTELCDEVGLTDDTKKMTYKQFKENWLITMVRAEKEGNLHTVTPFPKMFDIVDLDENGVITLDEWITHYKAYGIDTAHAPASFEAMDTNHDGVVTRDEFAAYYDEFFYTADDKLKSSILYGPLP